MTLPASALPVELPPAFLGVLQSATGKLWRDRLDARGAARALAITQRYQLPEMLARVLASRGVDADGADLFLHPTLKSLMPDPKVFAGMDDALAFESPGTWLAVTSISFDISVLELFWTLARGFKVVIQDEPSPVALAVAPHHDGGSMQKMDFSLFYFAADAGETHQNKYRLLLEGATFADQHGFAAVWTPERHFHEFGGLYPNPALTSAAIATITSRLQIRAGSVVLPLHNPLRVAEEWSVVDNLSQGRVGLSFASGWHANDFALMPENYRDRKDVMCRGIEMVRKLWRGEAVPTHNGKGEEIEVRIFPPPLQRFPRSVEDGT
jgi:hypothetical protein